MTEEKLIHEVGSWAAANFDYFNPWRGIIEEMGELAHCLLKRDQKIRGFDDPEYFKKEFFDAVGDIGVYAAHFAYLNRVELELDQSTAQAVFMKDGKPDSMLRELTNALSRSEPEWGDPRLIVYVIRNTAALCAKEGGQMNQMVYDTWDKVKKRNWRVNPVDAARIAEEKADESAQTAVLETPLPSTLDGAKYPAEHKLLPLDWVKTQEGEVCRIQNVNNKDNKAVVLIRGKEGVIHSLVFTLSSLRRTDPPADAETW